MIKYYNRTDALLDHTEDNELGIIQTKGRLYNSRCGCWQFTGCINEHNKKFDYLIYCASEDGKIIERIYIVPKKEIEKITVIKITREPTKRRYVEQWCEKYRINDKSILEKVNETWKAIRD